MNLLALTSLLLTTLLSPSPAAWAPSTSDRWQYQLQPTATGAGTAGGIRLNLCAVPYTGGACVRPNVYDIDLYGPDKVTPNKAAVTAIHAAGAHAVCYISAGSWEDWRPDKNSFPASVKGNDLDNWPGEKWLDIRKRSILLPIMEARVAKCDQAGFDSVEFDNVDAFQNENTGFPLTNAHQLAYNKALADLAHSYGLSVGLKNDLDQVDALVDWFDYAVNESCQAWKECEVLDTFLDAGKPVFQIEYTDEGASARATCPPANKASRSTILKTLALTATPWTPCR
ncbi:endo alpha-1,4 polygalactosaminidase [Nonomuraea endophytica]|uniref:endo alpha-1,4 polygalactosaminidase n=1 Tax=Nonomuraea endophytica TaxID=714136 RepID=UPI0037CCA795